VNPAAVRVAIVGTSCSGKTTFARQVAPLLDAVHVELDALHWGPGWTPASEDGFRSRVEKALAVPRWVCDGNYRAVRPLVWDRATAIVWLDFSFPRVLWRALARTVQRVITRETLYGGNRESFARAFLSRDSILLWVVHSHHARRRRYAELFFEADDASRRLIRLVHPRQAALFLETVEKRGAI
jgi:adenylate kinase family enzyme